MKNERCIFLKGFFNISERILIQRVRWSMDTMRENPRKRLSFLLSSFFLVVFVFLSACGGGGGGGSSGGSSLPTMNVAADSSGNGWVSVYSLNQIQEYSGNPSNQALIRTIFLNHPLGLAFDPSGNLWVANGQNLNEYNPSGTLINSISVGGLFNRVTLCGGDLWATSKSNNSITEFDPSTGQQIYSFIPAGTPRSLTCDNSGNLWITYTNTNVIQEYNPASSSAGPIATITPPNNPYGIAFCNGYLWVTNSNTNTIDEINPNGGAEIFSFTDPSGAIAENITSVPGSCNGVWYEIPLQSGSTDSNGTLLSGLFKLLNINSHQLVVAYGIPAPASSSGGGGGGGGGSSGEGGSSTMTGSGTYTYGVCSWSGTYSFTVAVSGSSLTGTNGSFTSNTLTSGGSSGLCNSSLNGTGLGLSGTISGNSINLGLSIPGSPSFTLTGTGSYSNGSISGANVSGAVTPSGSVAPISVSATFNLS